ncbi:MAG: FxLYD domain-containing protein [Gemmatimonadota bacterium]|nr:FxLYD domain-containing protein [Gemmatimonadota bacterium]
MTAARRRRKPLSKIAWVAIGLVTVAGLVWITLLPMRHTDFRVVDHALVRDGGTAIEGRLVRNGDAASNVLVEAYLYDEENRYLGTVQSTVDRVAADGEADFRIPVEPALAHRAERYTVYAGVRPNPFAPDR